MANGRFLIGKPAGGVTTVTITDGASNTNLVLPESGIVATQAYVDDLKIIATGIATFTATTNNINLTGIGVGVEIGDVIQISGAVDAKNNSEFTIDVILDANNIVVNQAHANKGTSKNIVTRASDTDVTIKLLSKHYNAEATLGRDWVDVSTIRTNNVFYPNNSNRVRKIKFSSYGVANSVRIYSGTQVIDEGNNNNTGARYTSTGEIPNGNDFKVEYSGTVFLWKELL